MLHSTHRRIAKEVILRLGAPYSGEEMSRLLDGVIAPDVEGVPRHHYDNSHLTNRHLQEARSYFLKDDLSNAYYCLGRALHYIQDSYVACPQFLPPGNHYRDYERMVQKQVDLHVRREQWIEESYFEASISDIEGMIQMKVKDESPRNRCSWIAHELSKDVRGQKDTFRIADLNRGEQNHPWRGPWPPPFVDLNLGFMASYVAAKSVLGPKGSPDLDAQLMHLFSQYENQLRIAETAKSEEIIGLVRKRDQLIEKVVPNKGIVAKVRNWVTGMKVHSASEVALSKREYYRSGAHMKEVEGRYGLEAGRMAAQYEGWYRYQIPLLSLEAVPRELLDVQVASKALGLDHQKLRDLLRERSVPVYQVGSSDFTRRTDLDKFLGQVPVNGYAKYPAQQ